jgi:hypothetical protein
VRALSPAVPACLPSSDGHGARGGSADLLGGDGAGARARDGLGRARAGRALVVYRLRGVSGALSHSSSAARAASQCIEPLRPIVGDALVVAVEADERPLARVLERLLGCEVARWVTGDGFGAASLDTPNWSPKPLVEAARGRRVIVADGGVAKALTRAGVAFEWLSEHAPAESEGCAGSCVAGGDRPLACCGGGGPLSAQHPEDAVRVARAFDEHMEGRRLVDARCRNHLRRSGLEATDLLDVLLEGA